MMNHRLVAVAPDVPMRFMCELDPFAVPPGSSSSGGTSSSGTETDTASPSPSPCPTGWTLYEDTDGAEGHDSCIKVFNGEFVGYSSSNAECIANQGHLLTSAALEKRTGAVGLLNQLFTLTSEDAVVMIGCALSQTSSTRNAGWRWVDDTDSTNLICDGSPLCGSLFGPDEPG